jgi:hypothetical protein
MSPHDRGLALSLRDPTPYSISNLRFKCLLVVCVKRESKKCRNFAMSITCVTVSPELDERTFPVENESICYDVHAVLMNICRPVRKFLTTTDTFGSDDNITFCLIIKLTNMIISCLVSDFRKIETCGSKK